MEITIRVLRPEDGEVLRHVAPDVFDNPIDPRWAAEFLNDPRHHLAVAIAAGQVIGFASGMHYVHPDKPPELWVAEVGVAPAFQNQGIGRRLLAVLFERGRAVGCARAWVATERYNGPARRLYKATGGQEDPEDVVVFTFDLERQERTG